MLGRRPFIGGQVAPGTAKGPARFCCNALTSDRPRRPRQFVRLLSEKEPVASRHLPHELPQAIVIGLIQGITELFPISSLGHTVLIPSWIGGTWALLVSQESKAESPYLAFVVGLHLATAVVLLGFYIREWVRLVRGFFRTLAKRAVTTDEERLAWLIVIATVPVGILGIVLEHQFRVLFAKPVAAASFLMVNGVILLAGESHAGGTLPVGSPSPAWMG